jgi:hypothetical protein
MRHCAITIVAPLDPKRDVSQARRDLEQLAAAHGPGTLFDASERRIHFSSFFMFPDPGPAVAPSPGPSFVVLEINADGSARALLRSLAHKAPGFFEKLFEHCTDRPAANSSGSAWLKFLRQRDVGADAFYVANPGRSVEQVGAEQVLRQRAQTALANLGSQLDCTSAWRGIRAQLGQTKPAPRLPLWMRWGTHRKALWKQLPGYGRLYGTLLKWLVVVALALCWPAWILERREAAGWVLLPWVIGTPWMLWMWLRERPVHASRKRKLMAWTLFVRAWFVCGLKVMVVLGAYPAAVWLGRVPFAEAQSLLSHAAAAVPTLLGLVTALLIGVFVGLAAGKPWGRIAALIACADQLAFSAWHCSEPHRLWMVWTLATIITVLVIGALVLWFLATLRRDEAKDVEPEIRFDMPRLDANTRREDVGLQNHLATVTELRPGLIRRYALRVVLRAVSLLATIHYTHGALNTITSIHFARFVVFSHAGRQWLLFMGNYDGGFSAYLGAFSPVHGTSAVWSCTQEFPRTLGLIWDGASDEQRFKAFGRKSQVRTLGWFSAHGELSTQDISAGTATHMALSRAPTGYRAPALALRLARALFGPPGAFEAEIQGPFDEAACDAALRRL